MVQYEGFRVYVQGSEPEATRIVELPQGEKSLTSMPD